MRHCDVFVVSFCRRLFLDRVQQTAIRLLSVVPGCLPVLGLVALTGGLSWWHGQQTIERLAFQVQSEAGARVHSKLESYLSAPQLVNQINRDAVRLNQLNLTDLPKLEQHLITQLSQFQQVSEVAIGTEQGLLRAVYRQNGLHSLSFDPTTLDPTNDGQIQNSGLNAAGERTHRKVWQSRLDVRQLPWYKAAIRAQKPSWSPVLPSADQQHLALHATQPLVDSKGRGVGVAASSLFLSEIDQFLSGIQVSGSGLVFIVERNGNLIGTSIESPATQLRQTSATTSQNALIRETAHQLLDRVGQFSDLTDQQLSFQYNGSRQFTRVLPYRDQLGLDWLIVIVIPESDFITQLDSNLRVTFWLCLAAVAIPWMTGGIITNRRPKRLRNNQSHLSQPATHQPVDDLSSQNPLLTKVEADPGSQTQSEQQAAQQSATDVPNLHYQQLQTVGMTAQAFNQIAEKLSLSFQQIEAENSSLEAQVRERTAQLSQALEFEDLLRRTSEKVRDSLDEAHILQTVVRELTLGLRVQGCDVSLYNAEERTSTLCYEHLGTHLSSAQGRSIALEDLPVYELLLQGNHTQFCLLAPLPTALRSEQAQFACLSCPIMDDQGVLGDLWLFRPKQQNFSLQEVRLVQQIANQCAIALRQSHLYQTAQAQVKELEQLHRIKDDFLNTVSHELRTPIANIEMGAQLLEMSLKHSGFLETTSAPVYRYLQILKDEAQHEMTLINTLLDLSRLDAGVEPYIATTIDPLTWIPHVVEPFIERTEMQQQRLQLDLSPDLPPLTTDLIDLERILSELLNNACKYTPVGEKIIVAACVTTAQDAEDAEQDFRQEQDRFQVPIAQSNRHPLSPKSSLSSKAPEPIFTHDLLGQPIPASCPRNPNSLDPSEDQGFNFLLKVTNSGIEIPKDEQDRIFEKFYRIPSNDPWKHGGTGLGLALVKGLVERLSGKIWVESGSGTTTFTVQLPLRGRR